MHKWLEVSALHLLPCCIITLLHFFLRSMASPAAVYCKHQGGSLPLQAPACHILLHMQLLGLKPKPSILEANKQQTR
jgi:hypothetical protein